jgi:hypothetical protein
MFQAKDYHAALEKAGAITSLMVLEGEDHFTIVERLAEDSSPSTNILLKLIKPSV